MPIMHSFSKHHKSLFFGSLLCLGLSAVMTPAEPEGTITIVPDAEVPAHVKKIGTQVSGELMTSLKAMLVATIKESGPVTAIDVCKKAAVPATDAISKQHGEKVTVRRTALKVRNPDNSPDAIDCQIFDILETLFKKDGAFPAEVIAKDADGAYRFYKPLVTQKACLTCHGKTETMKKPVLETIQVQYPEDKATGFSLGELRGVICVEIDS